MESRAALLAVPLLSGVRVEEYEIRAALVEHFTQLGSISARCHRSCSYLRADSTQETVDFIQYQYEGATVLWRHCGGESFAIDVSPTGTEVVTSLFRMGRTATYDHVSQRTSTEPTFFWYSDLYPEAYFLCTPPVPFQHFLSHAEIEEPTDDERGLGAADVLIVPNPGLDHNQRYRVAVGRTPIRVLSIELYYTNRDREDVLVERFRFSDWAEHNGQPFPLVHTKDSYSRGTIWTTRRLELTDLGSLPVPSELLVESGSTYAEANGRVCVVGSLPSPALADNIEDLRLWARDRPEATLFTSTDVEWDAASDVLAAWRPGLPELPAELSEANSECGPSCLALAMAMQLGGEADYRPLDGLAEEAKDAGGVSMRALAQVATDIGLNTRAIRVDLETLLEYEAPALLPVKLDLTDDLPDHFVLLAGASNGEPILMNPPSPAFVANRAWLDTYWAGDALVLARDQSRAPLRLVYWSLACAVAIMMLCVSWSLVWKRRRLVA